MGRLYQTLKDWDNSLKKYNEARDVLAMAAEAALSAGQVTVGTEHILLALTKEKSGNVRKILKNYGINEKLILLAILSDDAVSASLIFQSANVETGLVYVDMIALMKQKHIGIAEKNKHDGKVYKGTEFLDRFGRDFTQMAGEGKFTPLIGRKMESRRLLQSIWLG